MHVAFLTSHERSLQMDMHDSVGDLRHMISHSQHGAAQSFAAVSSAGVGCAYTPHAAPESPVVVSSGVLLQHGAAQSPAAVSPTGVDR